VDKALREFGDRCDRQLADLCGVSRMLVGERWKVWEEEEDSTVRTDSSAKPKPAPDQGLGTGSVAEEAMTLTYPEQLAEMRLGKAATVRRGPYKGDQATLSERDTPRIVALCKDVLIAEKSERDLILAQLCGLATEKCAPEDRRLP
jgi:hypothetical protein